MFFQSSLLRSRMPASIFKLLKAKCYLRV